MVLSLLQSRSRAALAAAAGVAAGGLVLGLLGAPSGARADTAPVPPEPVATVSADVLPTVQINGVVWAQIVVGNRVYATGQFTQSRPAGSPSGSNQTARSNILAYDLATGALVTSFAPTLNGQGLALAASSDGSRIYVAGDFTNVSGTSRQRIAALNATTGALITSFNASANGRVRSIATIGDTVYIGGNFSTAGGQSRSRLASFNASNGAVTSWNPGANAEVFAVVAPAGLNKIVAGGRFATLGGAANYGMGAVNATSGAPMAWPANTVVRNGGPDAAIWSLSTNGTSVFGTGYTYLVSGTDPNSGNFEGTFAADASSGALTWVTGCRGDTYGSEPIGGVLYSVGHAHDCASIRGNPQTQPWSFQRAMGQTIGRGPNNATNVSGRFRGRPAPMMLHWLPTVDAGSFTGQTQGAWSVNGNANYVVIGGEFPRVNGTSQQGLARFALRSIAPNRQGPQGSADLKPTVTAGSSGQLRVSWTSAWDRDNKRLTYEVLRGSTVAATLTGDSTWWSRPTLQVTDSGLPGGSSQTYRIRATDPLGNTVTSATTTATVPGTGGGNPNPTPTVAADAFSRTTSSGFGSAETGGAYATSGSSVATSVADGSGRISVPAGKTGTVTLPSTSSTTTNLTHQFWLEQVPSATFYLSTAVRSTSTGDYRLKLKVASNGQVTSQLIQTAGGAETALTAAATVPGVTYTAGQRLSVRVEANGSSPTTVRAKVWASSGSEPSAWLNTATDSTSGLQSAGSIGWVAYLSSSAAATSVLRVDNLQALRP